MKPNRLIITYASEAAVGMASMKQGVKESLKCTSLEAAKKIIAKRRKEFIASAVFVDNSTIERKLI
jgi:hypothetical protein